MKKNSKKKCIRYNPRIMGLFSAEYEGYEDIYLNQKWWEKYLKSLDFKAIVAEEEKKRIKKDKSQEKSRKRRQERKKINRKKTESHIKRRRKK